VWHRISIHKLFPHIFGQHLKRMPPSSWGVRCLGVKKFVRCQVIAVDATIAPVLRTHNRCRPLVCSSPLPAHHIQTSPISLTFVRLRCRKHNYPDLYCAFNAHSGNVHVTLPIPPNGTKWCRLVDTHLPPERVWVEGGNKGVEPGYSVTGCSGILLISNPL
jgi:hypothetical protein